MFWMMLGQVCLSVSLWKGELLRQYNSSWRLHFGSGSNSALLPLTPHHPTLPLPYTFLCLLCPLLAPTYRPSTNLPVSLGITGAPQKQLICMEWHVNFCDGHKERCSAGTKVPKVQQTHRIGPKVLFCIWIFSIDLWLIMIDYDRSILHELKTFQKPPTLVAMMTLWVCEFQIHHLPWIWRAYS